MIENRWGGGGVGVVQGSYRLLFRIVFGINLAFKVDAQKPTLTFDHDLSKWEWEVERAACAPTNLLLRRLEPLSHPAPPSVFLPSRTSIYFPRQTLS